MEFLPGLLKNRQHARSIYPKRLQNGSVLHSLPAEHIDCQALMNKVLDVAMRRKVKDFTGQQVGSL
jgi:hypothetical protein